MAQDYPIPRFHFQVDWGGAKISFTEVTGLVMEREKIEYRHSDSKDFNKISMPGLVKNNNITLKRGKFEGDFDFNDWLDQVGNERVENRRDVTITLLNEKELVDDRFLSALCLESASDSSGAVAVRFRPVHRSTTGRDRVNRAPPSGVSLRCFGLPGSITTVTA